MKNLSISEAAESDYIPSNEEILELKEIEKRQKECKHTNFTDEDGCLDCGYYSK